MGTDAIFDAHNWAAVPFHFWSLCFFALGCIVGSFLNVCIYRMPLGLSVVAPPSHCPHCKYAIPFYLNIPLVTWLALKGRCKNCGAPISPRYVIVEFVTGLAFLSCWLKYGEPNQMVISMFIALVYAVFLAGLICATFIDFEHFIIPDEITLGGAVVGFAASFFLPQLHDSSSVGVGMMQSLLGAAVGAGIVYAILRLGKLLFGQQKIQLPVNTKIVFLETCVHLPDKEIPYEEIFYRKSDVIVLHAQKVEMVDRCYKDVTVKLSPPRQVTDDDGQIDQLLSQQGVLEIGDEKFIADDVAFLEAECEEITLPREAMGLGDVKFMGAIGAFIGWQGALFSLMVSSMIGAAVGIILILMRRREWSSRMPYGPYIALAAGIWVFCGSKIFQALFH